ncbi:MAG: carbamoyl phosphate synthase large subunit, partial [bacterium]|nr:carbamoyl phosphate synthase large subunit [bacterium]
RVSRSSALASKATGFPIAKIAAKLAIGYTLDEIENDITRVTPASFEPTIDYVVVKTPRFAFEKFPADEPVLGIQMKSVGEAMAMGRTFREALGKAIRSLETGRDGFDLQIPAELDDPDSLARAIAVPGPERLYQLARAFQLGMSREKAHHLTHIDPWFLAQVHSMAVAEVEVAQAAERAGNNLEKTLTPILRGCKRLGMSDRRLAALVGGDAREDDVRALRKKLGVVPVYKRVDTCAAEFAAHTPYLYSSYEDECEARPTDRRKVIILGGGPNRIGQGIEFDYCCVHAAMALQEEGIESIMVNCNPETVSTDYDTSDRLYFEPVTL